MGGYLFQFKTIRALCLQIKSAITTQKAAHESIVLETYFIFEKRKKIRVIAINIWLPLNEEHSYMYLTT